jgi:predicted DsbA family dithiol-disulfide isomerase
MGDMTDPSGPDLASEQIIEVFADVGCPFTHVGLRRFVEHRARLGRTDVVMWVRSWPLEVVNGRPLDPDFIAEEVVDIREQAAPDLFAGFRTESFPATSMPALALSVAAYEVDARTGERVSLELRDLLFEQGVDVADPNVIADLAGRHGITMPADPNATVLAEHAEGQRRGVIGSPHFFTPAGAFFCPSLDVGRDAQGHLRVHADPEGFESFLATCFI